MLFTSMSVCRPLNRAKSMVGVPLISGTEVPLAVIAFIDWMVALNDTTLASGASVPTTNAVPVLEEELRPRSFSIVPQPETSIAPSSNGATLSSTAEIRAGEWVRINGSFPRLRTSRTRQGAVCQETVRPHFECAGKTCPLRETPLDCTPRKRRCPDALGVPQTADQS